MLLRRSTLGPVYSRLLSGRPTFITGANNSFVTDNDVFLFDCDGVIWRGEKLIENVPRTIAALRDLGKHLYFVTNNSTKSRAGYKQKFAALGLYIADDEIFSSSFAAAAYLESRGFCNNGKKAYVIGEKGITDELALAGIPYIGGENDRESKVEIAAGREIVHDPTVGAVVVGFDRHINYYKIQYGNLCLKLNKGCEFVATNTDATAHMTQSQEWAAGGTMVAALSHSSGKVPTVVGKPERFLIEHVARACNVERNRICMVGDRLDTDILFGINHGLNTILTLSGVTSKQQMEEQAAISGITPQFYVNSIADLL